MNMNKMRCTCGNVHWEVNQYIRCGKGRRLPGGRKLKSVRLLKKRMKWERKFWVQPRQIGCAISWTYRHATDARWDVVGRAIKIMEDNFIKKQSQPYTDKLVALCKKRMEHWD